MNEFEIINHFFTKDAHPRTDVIQGIGDDAAVVKVLPDHELVITTDTLIAGTHFPETTSAFDVGHKSLAVNLSDLAAMGATPAWVTLAISLPKEDTAWLEQFCQGFFSLAKQYDVRLIGGDLTHGPLTMTITAMGLTPSHTAILRSQAKPGDLIYVTGTLGDAGLALAFLQKKMLLESMEAQAVLVRLNRPEPRVACGEQLRQIANAAIDISDGLIADLGHLLQQSHVGARVNVNRLPLSSILQRLPSLQAIELALTAGDDYELCFTVPPENCSKLEAALAPLGCAFTCIGEIIAQPGLTLHDNEGNTYYALATEGYQHF
ncbi:MAG: thiamine-phosphate kinase [Gammaproteobacteria bacterium]|nr:thiamine-phosphate kinase [Gammaproteobacteria bacterium]